MPRQPVESYPPPEQVTRLTLVPFMPGGDAALARAPDGTLLLPAGDVQPGEHYFDAAIRIPMATAGYRMQHLHPLSVDGTHLFGWIDGDRYTGPMPAPEAELEIGPADALATRLREQGKADAAALLEEAAESFRTLPDETYYAENVALLERAYLAATTPEGGSGFGRDSVQWRQARESAADGIHRDGTFIDIGCANGLLMESVVAWAAERGIAIEPYGVDLAPGLVALARQRLPQWADRIFEGNAIDWQHPEGMRFDFVHTLLDCIPAVRRLDMVRHLFNDVIAPGGRLLVSHYATADGTPERPTTAEMLTTMGFTVAGESRRTRPDRGPVAGTAWVDRSA